MHCILISINTLVSNHIIRQG